MSDLKELIKYIDLLEAEPFTGWTGGNKKGYLTACISIKKKAEKLLQEQANGVDTSDSGLHLQRVSGSLPSDEELQKVVERIAYEQHGEDQAEDCYAKMGVLHEFVKTYVDGGNDR